MQTLIEKQTPRYKVEESRARPGTFNVVDTKRVVAIAMGKTFDQATSIASEMNKGA
jgi:hypothetical protein